jgi:2-polyprenyl-6-hydroxyphenyl methylase/3-demethylubiquinone-9 3-methyltransferase
MTVHNAEIERFNQLAEQWWQSDGPMWPLHELNALRVPYVLAQVRKHIAGSGRRLEDLRLLDIGCGAGLLSEALARSGARVTAVDPAEHNIRIARAHASEAGLDIDYRCGSTEVVAGEQFDVVLNMEVVEHVDELPVFMANCAELLTDDGMTIVATINRSPLAWFVAIFGAEYVLGWLPKGTHQYERLVKPRELQSLLAEGDLTVTDTRGVRVNPLTRSFSLSQSPLVNYMVTATRTA